MPYEVKITTKPENNIIQYEIEKLKELREILLQYENRTIEVELHKVKEKINEKEK